jgi:hypothetical protein
MTRNEGVELNVETHCAFSLLDRDGANSMNGTPHAVSAQPMELP